MAAQTLSYRLHFTDAGVVKMNITDLMRLVCLLLIPLSCLGETQTNRILVFQSDFGLQDGAVSAMHGVALSVDADLRLENLTHEIPPFNVWEAAYRLSEAVKYWPRGTVFVSVVDPGVGTERKSVVVESNTGHYFVTPDNGTLTLVDKQHGIKQIRVIDEAVNRLPGSELSTTFHGRDVYAYTGARLAAGLIDFREVGPLSKEMIVKLSVADASVRNGVLTGRIPVLDARFGNVWTNIHRSLLLTNGIRLGDQLMVRIFKSAELIFTGSMPYVATFGDVSLGEILLYINSLDNIALAVNQDSFVERYKIASGEAWLIEIKKADKNH